MEALNLAGVSRREPLSILAERFPVMLSAFNELVREMRGAGIEIQQQVLLDYKVVIDEGSVGRFVEHFGHVLRGIRYAPAGRFTCNTVTVRGIDVAWMTLVREQNQ